MGRLSEREEIRWLRKKPRQPKQEQDILAKATAQSQEGDRRRPAQIFRFIDLS
jgi:transposase-like protein